MTRGKPREYKSDLDFPDLDDDATLPEVIKEYNALVKGMNFFNKFVSFQSNFDGFVASVTLPATTDVKIQHFLGVTPKWRVILRQEGNGVISDIPSGWNEDVITLRNNGAVEVKISVLIARE
jgi:hypothetical protein